MVVVVTENKQVVASRWGQGVTVKGPMRVLFGRMELFCTLIMMVADYIRSKTQRAIPLKEEVNFTVSFFVFIVLAFDLLNSGHRRV